MSLRTFSSLGLSLSFGLAISLAIAPRPIARANVASPYTFHQKSFSHSTSTCQLTRFTLTTNEFTDGDSSSNNYFTSMAAVIETSQPSCIRDYAIVQWTRGCMTNQNFSQSTGQLSPKYFPVRDSEGSEQYFTSPNWSVDTVDTDPMYATDTTEPGGRMDFYYVSKTPLKLKNDHASLVSDDSVYELATKRYFLREPTSANAKQIFVTDIPDSAEFYHTAGLDLGLITSPSLEFQTCVYDVNDIPLTGEPAMPGIPQTLGGPIQCYSWAHKYEFNTVTRDFDKVTGSGMDPFCLSPTPTPDPSNAGSVIIMLNNRPARN